MAELRDFKSLSDDELRALIGQQGTEGLKDIVTQSAVGLGKGLINLGGAVGDLQSGVRTGLEGLTGATFPPDPENKMMGSADIRSWVEQRTGPFPKAKTPAGKFMESVFEQAPGAALFPAKTAIQRGITAVAPALGGEVGETYGGPYGRAGGTLGGGFLGFKGMTPTAPARPEYAAMVRALEAQGIPISAGRSTGSKMVTALEDAASNFPLAGGRAATMQEATDRAFTGAALKTMGASGDELATPQVIDKAVSAISNKFETVGRRNNIKVDPQTGNDLVTTAQKYADLVPPASRAPIVEKYMRDIVDLAQKTGGVIPGKQYIAWRSDIATAAREAGEDTKTRAALNGIVNALDGAMARSVPAADKALFDTARREWANWKTLENAITGAGPKTAEGYISPSQLRTAVAGEDRGAYARGKGKVDLGELGRAGEVVLKPLPTSGTAERANAMNMYGFPAAAIGTGAALGGTKGALTAATPWALGYGVMSSPGQAWLGNRLMPLTKWEMARRLLVQQLLDRPGQEVQ